MITRSGPHPGRYRAHRPPPLPPALAARAVRLYQRRKVGGIVPVAALLGVNPLRVLYALEQAGVRLRGSRTWNPVDRRWLYHRTPKPTVAAELAAWRRYRAYVEVMAERHRRRFSRSSWGWWRPDHKARYLASLWLATRAHRPARTPYQLKPRDIAFLARRKRPADIAFRTRHEQRSRKTNSGPPHNLAYAAE